ncbi:hypothetical protein FE784_14840 [Paenibacillus hemerocallicola]|uniref:Uncharacterized protein n=1 Tax=Paenibacillus hemerocallicola TaxID=1172614 RepID=A0A5C4T8T6_9BACL|nr:hypothetical protein [Paenibacillus hemerocallicola]TNJ65494.1 hypothetical protein FE784_14840 [Paenibacillus hemerocallicola]
MITKVNQVSLDDLEKINPSDITPVLIENKISDPKLDLLRNLIRRNDEIKIALVVDPAVVKMDGESANLEIVKKLGNVKYVSLLCFASEALESLTEL